MGRRRLWIIVGTALALAGLLLSGCSKDVEPLVGSWEGRDKKGNVTRWTIKPDGTYETSTNERDGASADRQFFAGSGRWRITSGGKYEFSMERFESYPEHAFQGLWTDVKGVYVEVPIQSVTKTSFTVTDEDGTEVFKRTR